MAAQTGTGFTNLSKILGANQGNQLGQTVASNIQNVGQQAKQGIQQAQNQFQTEADKNRLDTDENKQFAQQTIDGIVQADPSNTAAQQVNADQTSRMSKILSGTYQGPTDLNNAQQLNAKAQNAQDLGNLSTTGAGRQELLRRVVGNTGYNAGARKVDSALLGQSGQDLSKARQTTQGLVQVVNQARQNANLVGQQYQGQAKQFASDTTDLLNKNLGTLDTTAAAQFKAAKDIEDKRQATINAITQFASNQKPVLNPDGSQKLDMNGNPVMEAVRTTIAPARLMNYDGSTRTDREATTGNTLKDIEDFKKIIRDNKILNSAQDKDLFGSSNIEDVRTNMRKTYGFNPTNEEIVGMLSQDPTSAYVKGSVGGNVSDILGKFGATLGQRTPINPTGSTEGQWEQQTTDTQNNIQGLFNSIAKQLQNNTAAQNLTQQGVATQDLRNKYTALQQLLGKKGTDLTYNNAPVYQAGQLGVDTSKL